MGIAEGLIVSCLVSEELKFHSHRNTNDNSPTRLTSGTSKMVFCDYLMN